MDRIPMNIDVLWLDSRPEIRFKVAGSSRGDIVFRADDVDQLLAKIVHGYANALATIETLKADNKALRGTNGKI
jgi:hypothetical protein